ncbi:MAG: LysM peptidoglycan-binding domain-containing protein [Deltaproteobacteria bacterium]|nr:LysM peptidoglycan-binding domain-containing protein [Deltaproteobacteria bacterium]
MTQKDDDRINKFNENPEDNDYNEQYSIWKEDKKLNFGTNAPKLSERIPLSKFGIGFLILLILLILLFARNRIAVLENRIGALENSVKNIEEMADKLDGVDNRVAQVWEQAQTFQQFKERFDRSEAALASRMDQIVINHGSLQKQMSKVRTRKAKTSKTAKVSKKATGNRYHIVKPGETLYQIGPRYGLTVKKLRQINKLGDGDTIYPGQKLVVSP